MNQPVSRTVYRLEDGSWWIVWRDPFTCLRLDPLRTLGEVREILESTRA